MEISKDKSLEEVKVILKHSTSYWDFLEKIEISLHFFRRFKKNTFSPPCRFVANISTAELEKILTAVCRFVVLILFYLLRVMGIILRNNAYV